MRTSQGCGPGLGGTNPRQLLHPVSSDFRLLVSVKNFCEKIAGQAKNSRFEDQCMLLIIIWVLKVSTLPVSLSFDFRFYAFCSTVECGFVKLFSHIRLITLLLNKAHVLVELGATNKSPARSPTKIYTPLRVVSPSHSEPSVYSIPAPTDLSLNQARESTEQLFNESGDLTIDTTADEEMESHASLLNLMQLVERDQSTETPLIANDDSPIDVAVQEDNENDAPLIASTFSPRYSQFLTPELPAAASQPGTPPEVQAQTLGGDPKPTPPRQISNEEFEEMPSSSGLSINLTQNEVAMLRNVLDRIPQSLLVRERNEPNPEFSVSVVANPPVPVFSPPLIPGPGDTSGENPRRDTTEYEEENASNRHSKRPRPRYYLTEAMFRKHPVLKFFATGPIDREKTPYKWWCRVCRVELSLMSRGSLELLSHYKTETHLLKEHRIRMETPGLPLYDKEEVELQGIALQEAKRIAKDMHPISPQRDPCRLLVGQDKLPEIRSDSAPVDIVLSQIRVLELGLKHRGHVASLIAIHDEILQHSAGGSSMQTLNWSDSRIFVSIHYFYHKITPLTP